MNRSVILSLLSITLLNVLPLLLFRVGGDILFQLQAIDCFAGQFWQGDLYPRWCMEANAGLGSPLFLFYFPLPFYFISLLYPLKALTGDVYTVYIAGVCCATFATAAALYYWLKDIAPSRWALLGTAIALFVPYRMETMVYRIAYAELWAIALLPLLFTFSRDMARGKSGTTAFYALTLAALWLTHIPLAVVGMVFSVLYIAILFRKNLKFIIFGISLSVVLTAFHLFPAIYYRSFIAGDRVYAGARLWSSGFLDISSLVAQSQMRTAMMAVLTLLAIGFIGWRALRKRRQIPADFAQKECLAWFAIFAAALFLVLPVSSPLYAITRPLSDVALPWRMQSILILYAGYLTAIHGRYFMGEKQHKTWKGDFGALLGFLVLLGFFFGGSLDPRDADVIRNARDAHVLQAPEYRTRWEAEVPDSLPFILALAKDKHPNATIVKGSGELDVEQWGWDGITLATASAQPMRVKLKHLYFPVWYAQDEKGKPLSLLPEEKTGWMLLDIPSGKHRIIVDYATRNDIPLLAIISRIVSLLAAVGLGWYVLRRRKTIRVLAA